KPVDVRLNVDGEALTRGYVEAGERCEIVGIGPVPVTTARALLDDAIITLLDRRNGEYQQLGRPTRTIPAHLRRALEARDRVCGVMGCDNDQLLEIDHIKPLAQGGPTTLENTWRICRPHHRLKTYLGWTVDGPPGNRWGSTSSSGRSWPRCGRWRWACRRTRVATARAWMRWCSSPRSSADRWHRCRSSRGSWRRACSPARVMRGVRRWRACSTEAA